VASCPRPAGRWLVCLYNFRLHDLFLLSTGLRLDSRLTSQENRAFRNSGEASGVREFADRFVSLVAS
jgi:hypothetical protein